MARLTSGLVPHGGLNEFAAYRWFGETPGVLAHPNLPPSVGWHELSASSRSWSALPTEVTHGRPNPVPAGLGRSAHLSPRSEGVLD
jgi:hypothetical protein